MKTGILESKRYVSAPANLEPNTFIGGVAAEIPDAVTLASKLNISESDITYFGINGNDVEARIEKYYGIPSRSFHSSNITYFKDAGKSISTSTSSFAYCNSLREIILPGLVTIGGRSLFNYSRSLDLIYFPKIESLGESIGDDWVFQLNLPSKLYIPNYFSTNNNGNPDGDVAYAINQGIEVIFIENLNPPASPTNLSIGAKHSTALQINFDAPIHVNTIDYYKIYVNGSYHQDIQASGYYVTGLDPATTYNIQIIAVDEFYNRSAMSEVITTTTTTTTTMPVNGLVAYYSLEQTAGEVLDLYGGHHGVNYGATRGAPGKIGNAYEFSEAIDYIEIPYSPDFSFTNEIEDVPFSISLWASWSVNSDGNLISRSPSSPRTWTVLRGGDKLIMRLSSEGNVANRIEREYLFSPVLDQFYHIVATYDGSGTAEGLKLFLNGAEIGIPVSYGSSYVKMSQTSIEPVTIGKYPSSTSYSHHGKIDEIAIYKNKILSLGEILDIYNNGNGITL